MLTEKQSEALDILNTGCNAFITGGAGTGKSYLLRQYIAGVGNKKVMLCAPTGIAAINIGGSTLHRVFFAPTGPISPGAYQEHPSAALNRADIIVIDEISMCRLDLFEYVMRTIMNLDASKKRQIIVVGDFYQLPPVSTDNEKDFLKKYWDISDLRRGYAFQSPLWEELEFKGIVLTEVVRQDDKTFIDNLNMIRRGIPKAVDWFNENSAKDEIQDAIYLCGTNIEADRINSEYTKKLYAEGRAYHASIEGSINQDDKPTDEVLELKLGMQVMTVANNEKEGYRNGTIGVVEALNDDNIDVRLSDGSLICVREKSWDIYDYEVVGDELEKKVVGRFTQLPVKIAYAITIHKSQGQTYDKVNISPKCFEDGQLYVALSRVTHVEGMHLMSRMHRYDLKTSDDVKFFYRKLR